MRPLALAALLAAGAATPAFAGERLPAAPAGVEACGVDGLKLPGSDGCLRLGGSVRAETAVRLGGRARGGALVRNRAEGRVTADMRVPTGFGPLRVFGSVRGWRGE